MTLGSCKGYSLARCAPDPRPFPRAGPAAAMPIGVASIRLVVRMALRAVRPKGHGHGLALGIFPQPDTRPAPSVAALITPSVLGGVLVTTPAVGQACVGTPVAHLVFPVALRGIPPQIGKPVVRRVVIPVASLQAGRWRWAYERQQDKPVDSPVGCHIARGEAHGGSPATLWPPPRLLEDATVRRCTGQGLHPAQVADLVQALVTRDRQPALRGKFIHVGPAQSGSAMPPGRYRGRGGPYVEQPNGNTAWRWAA